MKIIISTGQGILTLFESAIALKKSKVEVKIITGWVPNKKIPERFINSLGRIIGNKNLSFGLNKRRPKNFNRNNINTCSLSEFLLQFLLLLSKFKIISRDNAEFIGWSFFGWQTKKFLRNADIFHVRSGAGQGGAIKKARKMGMKIVVDHSIAHPAEIYKQLLKANKNIDSTSLINPDSKFWKLVIEDCKMADIILVNSEYVKNSFLKNGFNSENIRIAHMGINNTFSNLKLNWEIHEKIKLLFIGSFGLRKGALIIVEAAEKLIKNNIEFELYILGTPDFDFKLPNWFINNDNIHLHGQFTLNELPPFLATSDIFIFPSYAEGSAMTLKMAMASGLPVIATEQSGGPIEHLINGFLILDDSSDALLDAIIQLAKDQKLRKILGQAASKTIKENHTWEKYGEEVTSLYSEILGIN